MSITIMGDDITLVELGIGKARLPSGREVYNTGKVLIGLHNQDPQSRDIGTQAEAIQAALLDTRRSPITYVGPTRLERTIDGVWWAVGVVLACALAWLVLHVTLEAVQ